jgi:hypothetical protein
MLHLIAYLQSIQGHTELTSSSIVDSSPKYVCLRDVCGRLLAEVMVVPLGSLDLYNECSMRMPLMTVVAAGTLV